MADLPGEFQTGVPITAHDYEEIVNNINDIYGLGTDTFGYGSTSSPAADLPTKPPGGLVENEDWLDLKQAFEDTSDHQGQGALPIPLPLVTNLEDGDLIGFGAGTSAPLFGNFNSSTNVSTLTTNSNFSTGEGFITENIGTSIRTTPWSTQIEHRFILSFLPTQDDARAYFNTGGNIQISASRAGSSDTDQNTAWTTLLSFHSPVIFDNENYFNLTTSFATIFTGEDISGGPYDVPDPITWLIQAKTDTVIDGTGRGGKGNIITIRSVFLDQHVGTGGGPDEVDGTFTSSVVSKHSDTFFTKPKPDYVLDEIPASPPFPAIPYDLIGT